MVTSMFENRHIDRGDMYYVEREATPTRGHEQRPGRPAIIVSNFHAGGGNTCMVVYLTTNHDRPDPDGVCVEIGSAPKPSVAICNQIKTVDTRFLGRYCGHVTDQEMAEVNDAMIRALALEAATRTTQSAYDPKPCRDDKQITEKDRQLLEQLAESWRRMALHLMERSA